MRTTAGRAFGRSRSPSGAATRAPRAGRTSRAPTKRPTDTSSGFGIRGPKPASAPERTQEERSDDDGHSPGRRGVDLVDALFRTVVSPFAVLREDARRGLLRLRHLQPHVPAGLLRRPG